MITKLTKEQGDVVKFASTGHNVCIFGKAGVGKTTVVESIIKSLTAKGLKCQIVCSTGISCDAYHVWLFGKKTRLQISKPAMGLLIEQ